MKMTNISFRQNLNSLWLSATQITIFSQRLSDLAIKTEIGNPPLWKISEPFSLEDGLSAYKYSYRVFGQHLKKESEIHRGKEM